MSDQTTGAVGLDTPEKFPVLQSYLQSLEKRIAELEAICDVEDVVLFSSQTPPPPPDKTAGWGC